MKTRLESMAWASWAGLCVLLSLCISCGDVAPVGTGEKSSAPEPKPTAPSVQTETPSSEDVTAERTTEILPSKEDTYADLGPMEIPAPSNFPATPVQTPAVSNPEPAEESSVTWLTNMEEAKAKAKSEGKLLFLFFTGSDWCGWCKKLKADVFDTPEFVAWIDAHAVPVDIDFPHSVPQSDELKAQNAALNEQYKANGFPTIVLTDVEGVEQARVVGYSAELLSELDSQLAK